MSAAAALLLALAALSAEERVRFAVERDDAAARCPSDDELAARVRARIGSEPFSTAEDTRAVHVTLASERRGLVARVVLVGKDGAPSGERVLRGAMDCEELSEQLVLAIAIAIDPLLLLRPAPREQDAPRASDDDAIEPPSANAAAPSEPALAREEDLPPPARDTVVGRPRAVERAPPLGPSARVAALGSGGVASPFAPGLRVGGLYQGELLSLEASVRGALPARLVLGASAGPVDVGALTAQLAPGVALVGDVAALRGALVVDAGAVFARGVGLAQPRSATVPWLAVGARGGMDIVLAGSLVLVVDVEGLVPLLRPRFVDGESGDVFSQAEGLAWTSGVGLAWLL